MNTGACLLGGGLSSEGARHRTDPEPVSEGTLNPPTPPTPVWRCICPLWYPKLFPAPSPHQPHVRM